MARLLLLITLSVFTLCFEGKSGPCHSERSEERGGSAEDTVFKSDVVVTASRLEQPRAEAPILVTTTDSKVLDAVQAVSLSEGLSFQPGLRLETNCQNCGFTQVRLNGLQGPYTQILIDSRPIFSALNGVYGLDQIPAAMIDRIEVTRGGGSALFGSGAIAGTINILTKEATSNGFDVGGTMRVLGDTVIDLNASASASWVSSSMLTGITAFGVVRDRDFYDHNGDNFSEMVKLKGASGGLRAHHYLSDDDRLSAEAHWIREFRRGGEMTDVKPEEAAITEQLDHAIAGGTLTYERTMHGDSARFSAYASAQHTTRDSYYGGNGGDTAMTSTAALFYGNTEDLVLVGGAQYSSTDATSFGKDVVFVGGIEVQYNDVTDEMPGYERWIHQRTTNIGPYAQVQYAPGSSLSIALGGRLDVLYLYGSYIYTTDALTMPIDRTFVVFNPRINFMGAINEQMQWRIGYAMGFRGPQAFDEDLHLSTLQGAARVIVLAPDLNPERSHSITASFDHNDRSPTSAIGFTVEGFATLLQAPFIITLEKDIQQGAGYRAVKDNGDASYVAGVNVEGRYAVASKIEMIVGATLQTTGYATAPVVAIGTRPGESVETQISTSTYLRTPSIYGNTVITWQPFSGWSVDGSVIVTGPMNVLNERTLQINETPWFAEVGLKIGWDVHDLFFEGLEGTLSVGVGNIFNAYQQDLEVGAQRDASYVYGPSRPRTFQLQLSIASL